MRGTFFVIESMILEIFEHALGRYCETFTQWGRSIEDATRCVGDDVFFSVLFILPYFIRLVIDVFVVFERRR